jgi:hypothetical protein
MKITVTMQIDLDNAAAIDVGVVESPPVKATRADQINKTLELMGSPNIKQITTEQTGVGVILDYVLLANGQVLVVGIDSVSLYGSQDMACEAPENTIWEHDLEATK